MKITTSVISLFLKELEPEVHVDQNRIPLIQALFFLSEEERLPYCGYLCQQSDVPDASEEDIVWFCIPDGSGKELPEEQNYILFHKAQDNGSVMNAYMKMVMRLTDWDRTMHQAIMGYCSLEELLKLGAQLIDLPMAVFDTGFSVLGFSSSGANNPLLFERLVATGYTPPEIMKQLVQQKLITKLNNVHNYFVCPNIWSEGTVDIHRSCHDRENVIGYATVFAVDDYSAGKGDLIEIFFSNLESWMIRNQKSPSFGSYGYDYFLSLLVADYYDADNDIFKRAETAGLSFNGNYFLIMLQFSSAAKMPADYIWKQMDMMYPELKPFIYNDHIFILGNSRRKELMKVRMEEYLTGYPHRGYFSNDFSDLNELYDARLQCEITLNMEGMLPKTEQNLYYNMIAPYVCLTYYREHFHGKIIYDSRYLQLKEWDSKKGTTFCNTLYAYLRNACDLNKTSEELFCHRNTVSLHIRKSTEIMSCDLALFSTRLSLLQSFLLEDLQQQMLPMSIM